MNSSVRAKLKSDGLMVSQKDKLQLFIDKFNEWIPLGFQGEGNYERTVYSEVRLPNENGFRERMVFSIWGEKQPYAVDVAVRFINEGKAHELKPDIYVKLTAEDDAFHTIIQAIERAADVTVNCDEVRSAFGFSGRSVPYRFTVDRVRTMGKQIDTAAAIKVKRPG